MKTPRRHHCNARTRTRPGGRCRRHAMANGRCYMHGGSSTGARTPEGLARAIQKGIVEGNAAWRKRMHEARALGIIEHVPWYGRGWRKNRLDGQDDRTTKRTLKEAAMTIADKVIEQLPAPVERPFAEQTMGEQLATNTRAALVKARDILAIPCEDDNYKLMSIQKDLAQSLIATQVRVDESAMKKQSADKLPELLRRLQAIQESDGEPKLIDATPRIEGFEE